jgi:hypothetical protein
MKTQRLAIAFIGAAFVLAATASVSMAKASPKPIKYKTKFAGTFINTAFSFDGSLQASITTFQGRSTSGGAFTGQSVAEYADAGTTCSLPDGSTGEEYKLVGGITVGTYNATLDQVYSYPSSATECLNTSTGAGVGTQSVTLFGGTGKYANVSGTESDNFTFQILTDTTATGGYGYFGANAGSGSGSYTP